jgi:hypothetical protein
VTDCGFGDKGFLAQACSTGGWLVCGVVAGRTRWIRRVRGAQGSLDDLKIVPGQAVMLAAGAVSAEPVS